MISLNKKGNTMPRKKYRDRYIANGRCVDCPKKATVGAHCHSCRMKNIERASKYYKNNREKRIAYAMRNQQKRVEEGRCKECGAPLQEEDKPCLRCFNCRTRARRPIELKPLN